jgi:probable rRNA maturation factor
MLEVEISNEQASLTIDEERLTGVATQILTDAGFVTGSLSIAIVDDPTIHKLNAQYLQHDYPTDVLSFVLESTETSLEGQIIASADTAIRQADEYGWKAADELLLYVIHGTLHLVGHDDLDDESLAAMRVAEAKYLAPFGLKPQYDPE